MVNYFFCIKKKTFDISQKKLQAGSRRACPVASKMRGGRCAELWLISKSH